MRHGGFMRGWLLLLTMGMFFSGIAQGGPTVVGAYWGDLNRPREEKKYTQVKDQLQQLIKDNALEIEAGWQKKVALFGDPVYGVSKGLVILIQDDENNLYLFQGNESDSVSFPTSFTKIEISDEDQDAAFGLKGAWYGNLNAKNGSSEVVDVTDKTGATDLGLFIARDVNKNNLFGVDPKFGWQKGVLFVVLEQGEPQLALVAETEEVAFGTQSSGEQTEETEEEISGELKVLAAFWGDLDRQESEDRYDDVTQDVANLVDGAKLEIPAGYSEKIKRMGDPAPGVSKGLLLVVDLNRRLFVGCFNEQDEIAFPKGFSSISIPQRPIEDGGLYILKCEFGNLNASQTSLEERADVTREVRGLTEVDVDGNKRVRIPEGRNKLDIFDIKDPKPRWVKGFYGLYLYGKKVHLVLASENEGLLIPDAYDVIDEEDRAPTVEKETEDEIEILFAVAGDLNRPKREGYRFDVTDPIQEQVVGDKLDIPSSPKDINLLAKEIKEGVIIGGLMGTPGLVVGQIIGMQIGAVVGTVVGLDKMLKETATIIIARYNNDIYFGRINSTESIIFPDSFEKLTLPEDDDKLDIIKAGYGNLNAAKINQNQVLDVTEQLADMVQNDYVKLIEGVGKNETFGSDPMPNWFKGFYCLYQYKGMLYLHLGTEISEVRLPNQADLIFDFEKALEKKEVVEEKKKKKAKKKKQKSKTVQVEETMPEEEKAEITEKEIEKKETEKKNKKRKKKRRKKESKKKTKKAAKKKIKKKKSIKKKKKKSSTKQKNKKLTTEKAPKKKNARKKMRRRIKRLGKKGIKRMEEDALDDALGEE